MSANEWDGVRATLKIIVAKHDKLLQKLAALAAERDAWKQTAEQESRNRDYYRGLLVTIGEWFGVAAKTQDDGGVVEDVLVAKVPELVAQLTAEVERLKAVASNAFDKCEALTCALLASESKRPLSPKQEALLDEAKEHQLRTALLETREALAFVIGDHSIPGDCYSTGPVTGTPLDAVCPSCSGISVLARHAALAGEEMDCE